MAQNRKKMVDGGHLEFWYLDSSKYKNDARNGLSMPYLVGKIILHGFLWPFTFKLHFQYGRRRPSWILMVGLLKYKNDAKNGFSIPKLAGKVVLRSFRCQFVSKLHFQYARSGHGPTDCTKLYIQLIGKQFFAGRIASAYIYIYIHIYIYIYI